MRNVARLAVPLFDGAEALHGLGPIERRLLWCAALLHDTGYAQGDSAHHKGSHRVIRSRPIPGFTPIERELVACVARGHRGADPRDRTGPYAGLEDRELSVVTALAAILRIADGLDRGQVGRVSAARLEVIGEGRARVSLYALERPETEMWGGQRKAALFEDFFAVALDFDYAGVAPRS